MGYSPHSAALVQFDSNDYSEVVVSMGAGAHRPEDKYVKLPAVIHATRLGYSYRSIKGIVAGVDYDSDTNVFYEELREGLSKVNGLEVTESQACHVAAVIRDSLAAEDLGRSFFKMMQTSIDDLRLIDFDDPGNNVFTVVTELPYTNGDESFRPDITFLVNGMPLCFFEAKRQNNKDGIIAERERMYSRFSNPIYRRFVNITQIMAFSNNMEYDNASRQPLFGSYYASSAYGSVKLNHFREEHESLLASAPAPRDPEVEKAVLKDNGLSSFWGKPEFESSIDPFTPANRIVTSLFSPERLVWLLRYGICYVEKTNENGAKELQKHVMRYPQLFATKAVERHLGAGRDRGVIWHTQGSGKTALAFFLSRYLTDWYQARGTIAQFFFIVDRLDLADQARDEFAARDVSVRVVSSRKEFGDCLKNDPSTRRPGAEVATSRFDRRAPEITVVNIQKFSDDAMAIEPPYSLNVQRIFFLDEAHRDYKPGGSFLASLMRSDEHAVKIALTGTPLIGRKGASTRDVFGPYIHRYFYNRSIDDGYTLRLMREVVKSSFRVKMQNIVKELREIKGVTSWSEVFEHDNYVKPLVAYIVDDYLDAQVRLDDESVGAMVVASSAKQARKIHAELQGLDPDLSCALVLHDEGSKDERRGIQMEFKRGGIDILVVYNMLLTGFDAPRLKRLYLCRKIKEHNLLQCLTRVNRPYRDHPFGYVIDFADIREEYDKTNQAYLRELEEELGDSAIYYESLFVSPEEIESDLAKIKDTLFLYSTDNVVEFQAQVNAIQEKPRLYELRAALARYRELRNVAAMHGFEDLYRDFDMQNAAELLREVQQRIDAVNAREALAREDLSTGAINVLLAQLEFSFKKQGEQELKVATELEEAMKDAYREASRVIDSEDPEFIDLLEELRKKMRERNVEEMTAEQMTLSIDEYRDLKKRLAAYCQGEALLAKKYGDDPKFVRAHKRAQRTPPPITDSPVKLVGILTGVKAAADALVGRNVNVLGNVPYFLKQVEAMLADACDNQGVDYDIDQITSLARFIAGQYEDEKGKAA